MEKNTCSRIVNGIVKWPSEVGCRIYDENTDKFSTEDAFGELTMLSFN